MFDEWKTTTNEREVATGTLIARKQELVLKQSFRREIVTLARPYSDLVREKDPATEC